MSGPFPRGIGRRAFLAGCAGAAGALVIPRGRADTRIEAPALRIQRLSWAGICLLIPGGTLWIDPLIDPDAWGDQLPGPLVPLAESSGDTGVLVTHTHPDHFDPSAVAVALAKGGTFAYPAGTQPLPVPAGARARPSPLWEPQLIGEFTATPVPAADGYGDTQVSWIVSAGGRRIFHGGDTQWHGHWWRIGRQFGPFDAAFLPINGAQFGWRKPVSGQPGVLTPEQAVAAARILGARRLVPIHYGAVPSAEYREVSEPLARLHAAASGNELQVQVLAPGAWLDWQALLVR